MPLVFQISLFLAAKYAIMAWSFGLAMLDRKTTLGEAFETIFVVGPMVGVTAGGFVLVVTLPLASLAWLLGA